MSALKRNRFILYGLAFFLMLVAGAVLVTGSLNNPAAPARLSWQLYSLREPVLRLHVIASSDATADQLLKEEVVALVRRRLGSPYAFQTMGDCRNHLRQVLPCLEEEIRLHLQESAPGQAVTLGLTRSDFPLRAYGTRLFPPGQYLALKVVLGAGQGENWWCLLFPSLCLPVVETGEEDEPDFTAETLGPEEGSIVQEPPRRRWFLWEWLEKWLY